MPVWPVTLPQTVFLGAGDTRQQATSRFSVDAGPAKQRRKFQNAARQVSNPMTVSNAQRSTLDDFYVTTLLEGSLPFDWVDPVSGALKAFRFIAPIAWVMFTVGQAGAVWRGTIQLELLP